MSWALSSVWVRYPEQLDGASAADLIGCLVQFSVKLHSAPPSVSGTRVRAFSRAIAPLVGVERPGSSSRECKPAQKQTNRCVHPLSSKSCRIPSDSPPRVTVLLANSH